LGVIRVVDCAAHVGRLENGTILIEESLVVSQVVWVDLEEVAHEGETLGAGDLADGLAVYGDGNWVCGGENFGDAGYCYIRRLEANAWKSWLVMLVIMLNMRKTLR
jgi:hypothetical protein